MINNFDKVTTKIDNSNKKLKIIHSKLLTIKKVELLITFTCILNLSFLYL